MNKNDIRQKVSEIWKEYHLDGNIQTVFEYKPKKELYVVRGNNNKIIGLVDVDEATNKIEVIV